MDKVKPGNNWCLSEIEGIPENWLLDFVKFTSLVIFMPVQMCFFMGLNIIKISLTYLSFLLIKFQMSLILTRIRKSTHKHIFWSSERPSSFMKLLDKEGAQDYHVYGFKDTYAFIFEDLEYKSCCVWQL